jgi:methylated-DNA-[protein]-cysteine S-methyltransferase
MKTAHYSLNTPIGQINLGWDEATRLVTHLCLSKDKSTNTLKDKMNDIPSTLPQSIRSVIDKLNQYFKGNIRMKFDLKSLDFANLTAFQRQVYLYITNIPPGKTQSYATVALSIGNPKAARAIGRAMAINPFPIIIPCHRIIAGDGTLGGYTGGLKMKEYLLKHEQRVS